jgi:hypothetical protein
VLGGFDAIDAYVANGNVDEIHRLHIIISIRELTALVNIWFGSNSFRFSTIYPSKKSPNQLLWKYPSIDVSKEPLSAANLLLRGI